MEFLNVVFPGRNGGSLKVTAHAVMNQHHLLEGLLFYLEEEAQAVESPDSQFVSSQSGNKMTNHVRLRNRPIYYDFDLFQKSLRHPELNDVSIRDLNYTFLILKQQDLIREEETKSFPSGL